MVIPDDLLRASQGRLWHLIQQRMEEGADTAAIDEQIWNLYGETWAIVFTDLAGFSRRVEEFGITHFLQVIYRQRELLFPVIRDHGGILVKDEADSLLLIFRTVETAIDCSVAMQQTCARASERLIDADKIHLCLGIGYGDVLRIGAGDIWGREVNAASKLGEDTAEMGEVLVTEAAVTSLSGACSFELEELDRSVAGSERNYRLVY